MSQPIEYRNRAISSKATLLDAFKMMDQLDKKLLVILDEGQFKGLLSSGDIQRAIIKGIDLKESILVAVRDTIRFAKVSDSATEIKRMMLEFRMEMCPVLNDEGQIVELHFWEDIFGEHEHIPKKTFNVPVVVMAGGFGTRMKPLTNVIPKPLIPFNEKTMVEEIISRFEQHGCTDFILSVNYKADLIKYYLKEADLDVNLNYILEDRPLGTAGSLSLLTGNMNETFFVTNCDILIDQDYAEILAFHQKNKHLITVVSSVRSYDIPYGTIETGENGQLLSMTEKPEISFMINTGMYIIEPEVLKHIPKDSFMHITTLIEKVSADSSRVGVFPVSEKSWTDIGNWDEYLGNIR
jgi:dTDP-glucose pyrophosphorylase